MEVVAVVMGILTGASIAHPLVPRQLDASGDASGGGGSGSISPALWAPIVVVPIIFVAVMIIFRNSILPKLASFGHGIFGPARTTAPSQRPSTTRELTAAQLMGSTAVREAEALRTATANGAGSSADQPRRTRRRPRRTPSQISTKSLPPYMAEAGEQELVLVRPRHDEENETSDDAHDPEHDESEVSTPLLDGEPAPPTNLNATTTHANGEPAVRPSMDSHMSSNDSHNTNRSSVSLLDRERGEAPPYFEVVENADHSRQSTDTQETFPDGPPSSFRGMGSAFRRFFPWNPASRTASNEVSTVPMQQRNRSQVSFAPASPTSSSPNASRLLGHRARRPSHSLLPSSPSLHSLIHSRSRSTTNLALPPQRDISAPLPHSVIRTNFNYPASGPTAEQMAFLSSTASLLRFGVPLNDEGEPLERPPPSFNDVVPHASTSELSPPEETVQAGRSRSGSTSSNNRSSLSLSTRDLPPSTSSTNLTSLPELPTPITPSKHGHGHETSIAASVPLPATPSSVAPSSPASLHPLVQSDTASGTRRVSNSTTASFTTAPTHALNGLDSETETETEGMGSPLRRANSQVSRRSTGTRMVSASSTLPLDATPSSPSLPTIAPVA